MKHTEIDTTTHVAGCAIEVGKRIIQRCLICGEKLGDNMDAATGNFWKEGELVKADHGFLYSAQLDYTTLKKLPRDSCIQLVEI